MESEAAKKRRKKIIIIIAVILLIFFGVPLITDTIIPHGCPYCDQSAANSNAKLTFQNTAEYSKKCADRGNKFTFSGVISGELSNDGLNYDYYTNENGQEYEYVTTEAEFNGVVDDYRLAMNISMAGRGRKTYYIAVLEDGLPVHSFWSRNKRLMKYADKIEKSYLNGTTETDFDSADDFGKITVGGYPKEIR